MRGPAGILCRLLRDRAGNTLALVAAGLIPLLGLIGGGVDMSRIYLTKTRMQQACDAGALAGRRTMSTGAWSANSNAANTAAVAMYNANFQANSYGSTSTAPTFSESSGTVTGTASATLPMTIMKVFSQGDKAITVTCSTKMEIPNTDVMFVLDTTGSMADCANGSTCNSNSNSKIAGLKEAVKCFYEALAKVDTSCTGTPSGSNNPNVQLRFGFMPYATNVNVGKLLPTSYIADNWKYQSRVWTSTGSWSSWQTYTTYNRSCSGRVPANTTTTQYQGIETSGWFGTSCTVQYRRNGTWTYKQLPFNVSSVKSTGSMQAPIGEGGANRTVNWDGCIEERQTVKQASYDPIDSTPSTPGAVAAGAKDLDIDSAPTGDVTTQWGPALPGLIFTRQVPPDPNPDWSELDGSEVTTIADYYNDVPYYCPVQAKKLQIWSGATAFETYVDSLTASGNTYHDIGLLWGARFISPTGIFASENAFTTANGSIPGGGTIQRHIIFMTDGDTNAINTDYAAYGFAALDRRTTSTTPAANSNINNSLNDQVNARYAALCTAITNRGITLWVISYGTDVTSATKTRLQNCASPGGHFFNATSTSALISNFQAIASNISKLRLTQ